jgi:hypothetical protein
MRWLISIFMTVLPVLTQADTITMSVPSAVAAQIDVYSSECAGFDDECDAHLILCGLKWSVNSSQPARMYPTQTNGYEDDYR